MDLAFRKSFGKWFATDVLRAIRRFDLIAPGERVAVGLSGGKDSVTLLYVLAYLRRHSHLRCELSAIHVRTAAEYDTAVLREYCAALELPYREEALRARPASAEERVCSACARLKRGAAVRALTEAGIQALAYGHHADDAAETLLMNLAQHGRLESFAPRLAVGGAAPAIIRPLILLSEETVAAVHRRMGLPLLAYACPYAARNVRGHYKTALRELEARLGVHGLSRRVVDALARPPDGEARGAGSRWVPHIGTRRLDISPGLR